MKTKTEEFYIGWQDRAPAGISRHIRLALFALAAVAGLVCALLVLHQSGFATSTFELGRHTELEGVLLLEPAPFLQIDRGPGAGGQPVYQHILLVGQGKHGAEPQLEAYAREHGQALAGRRIRLEGTLIYHDSKTLLEVASVKSVAPDAAGAVYQETKPLGSGYLLGEITDPKCLFGVMKPGFGKPHRSCAARCIAGGIPPVLKTTSGDGRTQYYLLTGAGGEMITETAMPFAGDLVFICGQIRQFGDWLILERDPSRDILLAPRGLKGDLPLCE